MGKTLALATITVACALALGPSRASACGGCFHPPNPTGTVSVVNAHRMAFLSSPSRSILWDQIQYTGSPADFVWVLPVMGTPTVEVGDNGFFESLVQATNLQLIGPTPPRTSCPPQYCGSSSSCGCLLGSPAYSPGADAAAIFLADAGAVHVYHEGVVGPYDTATIGSTDPMALVTWLQDHGYEVPDTTLPTIAHYTSLGMNFVALRLRPMVGVDRMAPIRVSSPGLSLTLPLRMIAAGVGADVSLELFVFAERRMQTATFPNAEVDRAALTYDWTTSTFDYEARFEDALFSGGGAATNWVTEYAQAPFLSSLAAFTSGTGTDMHSAAADMALVQAALPEAYLTRLRTRLTPAELGADLVLGLSTGGDLSTQIFVTHELHRAADIDCPNTCRSGGCTVTSNGPPVSLGALVALLFVARRARRRS